MDAQINWVHDLGSPMEPGIYRFRGIAVRVTQEDIDRARAELDKVSNVIFNASLSDRLGDQRKYLLGSIA
jgi:hypothetical protein